MRKLLSKVALGLLATFIAGIAWASVNVTLNGTTYAIPVSGERGWGSAVTSWIQAASSHLLQKTGGTFTLGADVDFGSSFGLKSAYYKSRHATPATTGQIRLGNTEGIFWRNAANGANLGLSVDASNILTFNGNPIIGTAALSPSRPVITDGAGMLSTEATLSPVRGGTGQDFSAATGVPYVSAGTFATEAQVSSTRGGTGVNNAGTLTYGANNITLTTSGATGVTLPTTGTLATLAGAEALTNKTIDADSNTISNIENGDIKAAAAIARSKLASGTASHVVVNDGTGVMSSEAALAPVRGGTGQDLSGATGVPYVTAGTFSTEAQVSGSRGGTGVSNAGTLTYGANNITLTTSGATGVTLPTTGTLSTLAGAEALTNKTIDADSNTISNIENGDIKAAAAIARSKLANGTASHVVINDGTGVMSSEATLAISRGGTGQATAAAAFDALSPMTTKGDLIAFSTTGARVPIGTDGRVLTADSAAATGVSWQQPGSQVSTPWDNWNLGLATSVGSSALTIALKQADGTTDPSTGTAAVKISFRSSTNSSGAYNQRSVTSSLSMTVSSGSTLGMTDAQEALLYVYAIDNSGTVELAISQSKYLDGEVISTTAEGGGGGAASNSLIYSTTARANVPIRLIGVLKATEATAGTWATAPSVVATGPGVLSAPGQVYASATRNSATTVTAGTPLEIIWNSKIEDSVGGLNTTTGRYTIPTTGLYVFTATFLAATGGTPPTSISAIFKVSGATQIGNKTYGDDFASGKDYSFVVTATKWMTAGEYVSLFVSCTAQNVTLDNSSNYMYFSVVKQF